MATPTLDTLLALAALLGAGGASALLLRRAGAPGGPRGGAAIGGLVAGLLLGPGVLGAVAPRAYDTLFPARAEAAALRAEHRAARAALAETGAPPGAAAELLSRQSRARAEQRARALERWGGLAGVLGGAYLLCAAPSAISRRRVRTEARAAARAGRELLVGLATLPLAGAAPGAIALWQGLGWRAGAAFGVAFGAPAVGGALRRGEAASAALGSTLALAIVAWLVAGPTRAPAVFGAALAASLAIALLPPPARARAVRRPLRAAGELVALPAVFALGAATVDPHALARAGAFWILALAALLLASDGRWLAGVAARRALGAPDRAWTASARGVDAGAGALMLLIALVCFAAGLFDEAALGACVVGAVVIESTPRLRAVFAPALDARAALSRRR